MLVAWGPPTSLYRVHINHGIFSHFLAKEGMREVFFLGPRFFLQKGGGEEKIFFLGREFFYREAVGKFFLRTKDFLQGGEEGSKVVFA